MRGSRRLRLAGRLDRIARLREDLSAQPLPAEDARASAVGFGAALPAAEVSVRQQLLLRFADRRFVEALLRSVGTGRPVRAAIPGEWREVLSRHRFRTSALCSAMFIGRAAFLLGAALRQMARVLRLGIRRTGVGSHSLHGAAYFDGLGPDNLPPTGHTYRGDDVVSWFLAGPGGEGEFLEVWHDCAGVPPRSVGSTQVRYNPVLQPFPNGRTYGSFLVWCFRATAVAVFDLLRGSWWHAVVLRDAVVAAAFRLQARHRCARDYLFHNSSWFYRPLWTYEAESLGARVTLYFYSTNVEAMSKGGSPAPVGYGWRASSWPCYLVWDEWQERFVRRAVGSVPCVKVVGPVSFVAQDKEFVRPVCTAVAVFDVAPFRPSYFQTLGIASDYYAGDSAIAFISDTQVVTNKLGLQMLWKRKRHFGAVTHPRYRRAAASVSVARNVEDVDPMVAAARIIEVAAAVVSFPFTSTALIARRLGKPSCYYDPTGTVDPEDPAAHGIPVVRGQKQLAQWLQLNIGISSSTRSAP